MDVLAELSKVSDYAKDAAQKLVGRTNEVHTSYGRHQEQVNLDNFGLKSGVAHANTKFRMTTADNVSVSSNLIKN